MQQLIHAFGIDLTLILTQIVNFVLLAVLLTYFLYKPILNLIKAREAKIAQGIKDAELAATARAAADEHKKQILAEAQVRAEQMSANAKQYADKEADRIVEQARDAAAALLRDAHEKVIAAQAAALQESEAEIAKVAILATEKLLRKRRTQS